MRKLFGRTVIMSNYETITDKNVVEVLEKALQTHSHNRDEIDYLYKYYLGDQPILNREKKIRPEINNTVVENRAIEIVDFKTGYLLGEPIQYVSTEEDVDTDEFKKFNKYMRYEGKSGKDLELADWFHICGTAYRIALPRNRGETDEAPFRTYILDPRDSFVVYSSALGNKSLMGVKYITRDDNKTLYSVYTDTMYYEIVEGKITKCERHILGMVPIIEYPANRSRLGAFEVVIGILDAMNTVASNRIDGIEQFIQALLLLKNVDIESEEFKDLKEQGGVLIPPDGDITYLTAELNQMQTQTLIDYMYQTVLTICGMPNRNGGSSTSDTGSAVIMRDGWSAAESRALRTEMVFRESENLFIKLVLRICEAIGNLTLDRGSISTKFTRRNYENILQKAQVLTTMLGCDKIHPRLAFIYCGMFPDPESAFAMSEKYYKELTKHTAEDLKKRFDDEANAAKSGVGGQVV